ncbi:hypothetical protein [Streptomyces sp. NPDC002952]|uniref:hypothetical protein n=1 Tax=Streptomyces sp. NPDC002952 TaxID=3364673 RepID=UPI0036837183
MPTDLRIAVLNAISSPHWHPVTEAPGMPWAEAEALLNAYDASHTTGQAAPTITVGFIARALADVDHESAPDSHPAWDQLDTARIERYRTTAGRILARLSLAAPPTSQGVSRHAL